MDSNEATTCKTCGRAMWRKDLDGSGNCPEHAASVSEHDSAGVDSDRKEGTARLPSSQEKQPMTGETKPNVKTQGV